jgi:hypothetical protein
LSGNGFRAGVVGNRIPPPLAKLLALSTPPSQSATGEQGTAEETEPNTTTEINSFTEKPRLQGRHLWLRPGKRGQVIASQIYEQLPILVRGPDGVFGQTYSQAQAIFTLTVRPQGDGRLRVELLPEIHHGPARQRWLGDQGIFRLESEREKKLFENLALSAILLPGHMLAVTCRPDRPGSLGYYFFTEQGDRPEQKLLLIRLAQTPHDAIFTDALPLEMD